MPSRTEKNGRGAGGADTQGGKKASFVNLGWVVWLLFRPPTVPRAFPKKSCFFPLLLSFWISATKTQKSRPRGATAAASKENCNAMQQGKFLVTLYFFLAYFVGLNWSFTVPTSLGVRYRTSFELASDDQGFHMEGFGEAPDPDKILTGVCKWFDTNKGFGFISPDVGGADVFVHQSVIQAEGFRSLAQGEKVEYKLGMNEKTGKHQAAFVTGPDGANVEGAPFTPFF